MCGDYVALLHADLMTLAQLLAEAEAAYHQLMTGRAVVECHDQNGESVKYATANAFRLAAYIQELKNQLGGGTGSRPMQFWGR